MNSPAMEAWLATRPPSVQALAKEFPPNSSVTVEGADYTVLGWTEDDMVILTPIDPAEDYDGAVSARVYLCAAHLRGRKPQ